MNVIDGSLDTRRVLENKIVKHYEQEDKEDGQGEISLRQQMKHMESTIANMQTTVNDKIVMMQTTVNDKIAMMQMAQDALGAWTSKLASASAKSTTQYSYVRKILDYCFLSHHVL